MIILILSLYKLKIKITNKLKIKITNVQT